MEINKAAVALVVALCVGAGAGGAYLASRGSDDAGERPEAEALVHPASDTAVEQSEAVIADLPVAPAAAPAAAVEPARRPAPRAVRPPQPAAPPVARNVVNQPAAPAEAPRTAAVAAPIEPVRTFEPDVTRAPEPPAPQFEELVVAADSVIGLQVETALSSEGARVEDEVIARVTRDVRVDGRVVIPAGSRAEGEVTLVERGGKVRDRARLGVRFTSVVLADGTRVPIETETVYREGTSPTGESAAKIGGGAIGGAIIGGILGGAKGAMIGGSVGAGAGTAATIAGGRNPATLPAGTPVTVRVTRPATVTVER